MVSWTGAMPKESAIAGNASTTTAPSSCAISMVQATISARTRESPVLLAISCGG